MLIFLSSGAYFLQSDCQTDAVCQSVSPLLNSCCLSVRQSSDLDGQRNSRTEKDEF